MSANLQAYSAPPAYHAPPQQQRYGVPAPRYDAPAPAQYGVPVGYGAATQAPNPSIAGAYAGACRSLMGLVVPWYLHGLACV